MDTYGYDEETYDADWATLRQNMEDPGPTGCGCDRWECTTCPPPWVAAAPLADWPTPVTE